jgi:hypothetical protein
MAASARTLAATSPQRALLVVTAVLGTLLATAVVASWRPHLDRIASPQAVPTRQGHIDTVLAAAAGVPLTCTTTWPTMQPADAAAGRRARCPWLEAWPLLPNDNTTSGVVASFTTFAGRWSHSQSIVLASIYTLLEQTVPPDAIYVVVPSESRGKPGGDAAAELFPPAAAAFLSTIPRVRVLWTWDFGPASKFLTVLLSRQLAPETLLFVCDDDRRLPPTVIETLRDWART